MTGYVLAPRVQHYAWGDPEFIPALLGVSNPERTPYAELWMGTHPELPSHVRVDGELRLLRDVAGRDLPFLLKVLSAAKPLSIQAHPSERQARDGYARENASGVALDARERVYKDERAKPELLCALTDFYALRGFRPDPVPFEGSSLKAIYEKLMTMPQSEVDDALRPIVQSLRDGDYEKEDRGYWLLRCHEEFSEAGHYDRGLFSVYLLNLIHLKPGEAIYLDAGTLHAYLEGSGVEIMASSNNVLRGGLTRKHVDIPELLKTVAFEGEEPEIVRPVPLAGGESVYRTPARDFELRRITGSFESRRDHGDEILLVMEGAATIGSCSVGAGEAVFVPSGEPYAIRGDNVSIYMATVPK